MWDLLVIGELNADVIVTGDDLAPQFGQVERIVHSASLTLGASGAIVACGAARLGLRVGYVGVVGDDALGRFVLDALAARDVDTRYCRRHPDRPTGMSVILSQPDDRAILTALGTIDALRAADVPAAALAAARHVHVSSLYLLRDFIPDAASVLQAARDAGASTSVDTNWDPTDRWGEIDAVLAAADVFMPNAQEAQRITRADDDAGALARLGERVPTVAIKLGAEGAIAQRASERVRVRAPHVDVVDTTGAGDTFAAGLLAGILGGRDLPAAVSLAVACGSLSTLGMGGTDAQPTLEQAQALADTLVPTVLDPPHPMRTSARL